ncbi:MAG: extracellular solute-binding protein [SAR324 cluster bacterium]|uniref:Extracellular solute-binding protein n=1 Tax=SAR324 cluster bacterium TaxID=2024889 RepID=A0A7X9IIG1_9DELT|nr:extracellular solute-binding protein [SAR324 cluster bacterium]
MKTRWPKISRLQSRKPLLLLLFLFCTTLSGQAEELIILSPHWEGIRYEFQWAFQEVYKKETGKDLSFKWLDAGGTSEILRFVRSEYDKNPKGINIDLFFGGGVEPYEELKRQKLLETIAISDAVSTQLVKEIAGVPLIDPEFKWYAPVIGSFGILCNAEVLRLLKLPVPQTWEDLNNPKFHSWLASSDPRKSGSSHIIYEIILQAYGWERGWRVIFGLGQNIRAFSAQSNQPAKDVESGEVACAFAYDTQAWWAQQKYGKDKMPYVLPKKLTALTPDAVGILKGAPNREIALRFIDFLMSKEGQRLWIRPKGSAGGPKQYDLARMPVLPFAYSESGPKLISFNPFEWKESFFLDSDKASKRWNILNDLLGVFILEPHSFLRTRKANISKLDLPSETEILDDAESWNNFLFKDLKLREWKSKSKSIYLNQGDKDLLLLALPVLILFLFVAINLGKRRRLFTIKRELP